MLLGSGHHRKNESCYWLPPPPPPPLPAHPNPLTPRPPPPTVAASHCPPSCPPPLSSLFAHPSIYLSIYQKLMLFAATLRSARSSKVTSDRIQERPGMRPAFCIPNICMARLDERRGWGRGRRWGGAAAEGELGSRGEGRGEVGLVTRSHVIAVCGIYF